MKKNLLIAGLVLTIATSVISGTMAAYYTSVDLLADSVVAKAFVLTAVKNRDSSAITAPKIAPGEEKEIRFTVDANSETGMDVVIEVDVTNVAGDITPLTYKLYKATEPKTPLAVTTKEGKSFEYIGLTFEAGVANTEDYVLIIDWPFVGNNKIDTTFQNEALDSVQITVSGTQTQTQP